ncbi:hypothetical protein COB64_00850 [Candidatus Wolfebacteria bacterium]|nr:MAG: hypothetical protein COB64_00850 [Candidatus Wolfebacteria bacterium]
MTNQYFANPYNTSVNGFYFTDYADYLEQADNLKDDFGMPVEEFSLEFIDGDNAELFNLLEVNQATLKLWFDSMEELAGEDLVRALYLAEYLNVSMADILDQLDDVMLFEGDARSYAENYIEDTGLLDEMPENLRYYFDVDAFARDMLLSGDINEVEIQGTTYIATGC